MGTWLVRVCLRPHFVVVRGFGKRLAKHCDAERRLHTKFHTDLSVNTFASNQIRWRTRQAWPRLDAVSSFCCITLCMPIFYRRCLDATRGRMLSCREAMHNRIALRDAVHRKNRHTLSLPSSACTCNMCGRQPQF